MSRADTGISEELELARRHVDAAEIRLARQRELVDRLRRSSQPAALAEDILEAMEEAARQMQAHRDRLERRR